MDKGKFTDYYVDVTKLGTKIPQEQYLESGKYPIIDQGQKRIAGRWDDDNGLFKDVPAIIFGDHTRAVKYITEPFFIGADGVKILRPANKEDNPKYLYYALQAAKIPNLGYSRHFKAVKELDMRTYPRKVQDEIVARLGKIDLLIERRQEELSLMNQLVESRFIEMFGDPISNPMEWDMIPLGKRCNIITGNTPPRANSENYGEYIEWIKSDNINTPSTYITEAEECLSEKGFAICRFVESGSLLMTCIAGSVNCIGNVAVTNRRVAFNQQINAIVPATDEVLYLYWLIQLSKPAIHSTINKALKGILSKGQLSEMRFPFPPMELQEQFATFVQATDKSKLAIQNSLNELETLKKSLMQQYFN